MRRVPALPLCLGTLTASLMLALPATAGADVFGPISLVSSNAIEQVVYAHDPAISGNREYVAFDGDLDGLTGVWRRNIANGEVEPVAVGEPGTPAGDAELPSISESGRYISFTTTAELSPQDTNKGPDVYVRDMDEQPQDPEPPAGGAFVLASAVNGSTAGLTYAYSGLEGLEGEEERYGALAAGRSALSADGQEVVFVTTAPSNLDGESTPETPQLEVAVRHLASDQTEVVSVEYDPATGRPVKGRPVPLEKENEEATGPAYGAVYSIGKPPAFKAPESYVQTPQIPASISADGSTVAWLAQDIGEQARTLAAERPAPKYSEPLWRRIADGEEAPTRRVTGGSDPGNPACVASGETALPLEASSSDPCQGPFAIEGAFGVWTGGEGDTVPRLSADGLEVAFLANAPPVSLGTDFGIGRSIRPADLYVVDMREGLSRLQAFTPLTQLDSGDPTNIAQDGPIVDLGISPDGTQVAFTTKRVVFPLGSPAYVTTPAAIPGMLELFDVDLANDTLTRVTRGYESGASERPHLPSTSEDPYEKAGDGALSPSFSDDGLGLAFSSTASNLVFGDGNTPPVNSERVDGADVFLVHREVFPPAAAPQVIGAPPPAPSLAPLWNLGVTAQSLANGAVRLYIEVPGAGTLRALASSAVTVTVRSRASSKKGRRRARGHTSKLVLTRNVATATRTGGPPGGGLTTLTLTLARAYSPLAGRVGGLSSTLSVSFAAPGHPTLHERLSVLFKRKPTAHAAKRARAKKKKKKSNTGRRGGR